MKNTSTNESDPHHHVGKIHRMLGEVLTHARQDINKIAEPRAQVLFEVTAEVLAGLQKAYEDYEAGVEKAFQR